MSFNNDDFQKIPLQNKKVVKFVSTQLNVSIGGKYASLEYEISIIQKNDSHFKVVTFAA